MDIHLYEIMMLVAVIWGNQTRNSTDEPKDIPRGLRSKFL